MTWYWHRLATIAHAKGIASEAQQRLIHALAGYDGKVAAGAATYLAGVGDYEDETGVKHILKSACPTDTGTFGRFDR